MADEITPWWAKGDDNEPDLDYGDAPADPNDDVPEVAFRLKRSVIPPERRMSEEALQQIRDALVKHRRSKGRADDGSKLEKVRLESEDAPVTVLTPFSLVEIAELPQTPRGLAKRAAAAGWTVLAGRSIAHHAATLYQDDSKPAREGQTTKEYNRGDVRFPAEDRTHWNLSMSKRDETGHIAIGAHLRYDTRPARGAQKSAPTAFSWGEYRDPINGNGSIWPPATIYGTRNGQTGKVTGGWKFIPDNVMTSSEFTEWFDALVPPAAGSKKKAADTRAPDEKQRDAALAQEEWNG